MYLEIDEGYFEHPKTLDLCARLQDSKACVYPLRLWKWACRSAKSGKLGKISSFAMEKAVDYEPMDGRCFEAMCLAGFLDRNEDGTFEIHDWMGYTGGALKRMDDKALENRRRREEGKRRYEAEQAKQRTGIVPVQGENHTSTNLTQTRPAQTSPDKTSEEDSPRARSNTPANEPGKPSPSNVVRMFLTIRGQVIGGAVGVSTPFAQPQRNEIEKAEKWLAGMTAEESADIEPAIRLACKHVADGAQGWTHESITKTGFLFGAIVTNWRDLREELHGCAPKAAKPKVKERSTSTPIREW